jgi:NitT/TauT family transport system substrate-binding protein
LKSIKKLAVILVIMLTLVVLSSCRKSDKTKITVAEVAHSVFYSPIYVAMALEYFEEEGLEIDLVLTPGADKVMSAIISRDAQIGLCGPEAAVFVYNEGQTNYAISFAQLTQRDGSFLMSREKIDNWNWDMLKGKSILGGRKGGVPEMTLEYVLKQKGLKIGQNDPTAEVNVRTDIQFAAMPGAFKKGDGDYSTFFEPTATAMEKNGDGYIVASIGAESGEIPYTAFHATKSYVAENPEIIQKFTNAIYKGQTWVKSHTAKEIAELIISYFPEIALNDFIVVTQRHIDIDAWRVDPLFPETGYNRLLDVMELAKELKARPPYKNLIDNTYAQKAIDG